MSDTIYLLKGKRGWVFHVVSNRSLNIKYRSKRYIFKLNAEKDAKAEAKKRKAGYVPYEDVRETLGLR